MEIIFSILRNTRSKKSQESMTRSRSVNTKRKKEIGRREKDFQNTFRPSKTSLLMKMVGFMFKRLRGKWKKMNSRLF